MTTWVTIAVTLWLATLAAAYKFGRHDERIAVIQERQDKNTHEVGSAWIHAAAKLEAIEHRLGALECGEGHNP